MESQDVATLPASPTLGPGVTRPPLTSRSPRKAHDHRLPELDGIRALAIWMVMLCHMFFAWPYDAHAFDAWPRPIYQLVSHGWLGVDLFFLLSGFLISGILMDTKNDPRYFRNFYIRRVLRIMPLYFVMIGIWSLFYSQYRSYFVLSSFFGANLDYLLGVPEPHGPGVLWSLAVEEHFYLLWPLLVLLLSRRKLLYLSAAIFIGTPLLRGVAAAHGVGAGQIYQLSWFRFDGLAAGALLAMWFRSEYASKPAAARIAVALLSVLAVGSIAGARFGLGGTHTPVSVAFRYTQAYLIFGSMFVLAVAWRGSRWTSPLRWKLMQRTGALSYCLYLVHLSIGDGYEHLLSARNISLVDALGPTGAFSVRAVVCIAASFAIASISERYLEQPFLALKDKFAAKKTHRPAAVDGLDVQAI
jgi:peptidoglycan/LPS O-acetylase OafA/YrhL